MAKQGVSFVQMVVTLFLVTLVASSSLGIVYTVTKEPIEEAKKAKKQTAIQAVLPKFENNPDDDSISVTVDEGEVIAYPGIKNDSVTGVAIGTFTEQGYSGLIKLMVGFRSDGSIYNLSVLEHQETPGLGAKIEKNKSDFAKQFINKNPEQYSLQVKKDGGDVDAITAATISSRAYCTAVERAYEAFKKLKLTNGTIQESQ